MRIGPYEVLAEVGRGGMGVVYRARTPAGEDVAIKVLLNPTPERLARFERERRLIGSFTDADGFVSLVDAGESALGSYVVMPLVAGGTLRRRLASGPLGVDDTLGLGRALAGALGRAHGRGVVHRDLKPENILFAADGRPLVADLGLAKHFDGAAPGASQSVTLSQPGSLRGTFGYMAPEQAADAMSVGPQADVFALGAILYECLAGCPAFAGETILELLARVEAAAPWPLERHRPDAPQWLVGVVAKCLARDPEDRFADGAALHGALLAEGSKPPVPARSRVARGVAVAAALAAVAGMSIVSAGRTPEASPPLVVPALGDAAPVRTFPSQCRGFLATRRTRLLDVEGDFSAKHSAEVHGAVVTPDGAMGATCGMDGVIRCWDLKTGQETRVLATAAGGYAHALALSPDGRTLYATVGQSVAILDLAAGREVTRLTAGRGTVRALAVSPDGKSVVSGTSDGDVIFWNLAVPTVFALVSSHAGGVHAVAFHPDGRRVLSVGADRTLRITNVLGEHVHELAGHTDAVYALAVSPDGTLAVTAGKDGTLRAWDLVAEAEAGVIAQGLQAVRAVAFSPDSRKVLAGGKSLKLHVFDVVTRREVRSDLLSATASALAFVPGGARVLVGTWAHSVLLREVETGVTLWGPEGLSANVRAIAVSRDGRHVAATGGGRTRVVSGGDEHRVRTFDGGSGVALVRTGTGVLTTRDEALKMVELATGDIVWTCPVTRTIQKLAVREDVARAVVVCEDGVARLIDTANGRLRATLRGPSKNLSSVALSRDGLRALAGTSGGEVVILDAREDEERGRTKLPRALSSWEAHPKETVGVAWLEDETRVVSAGRDGTIRLWDLSGPGVQNVRSIVAGAEVEAIDVSPDGALVVGALRDRSIRLWRLGDGAIVDRIDLASSTDTATAVAFDPGGRSFHAGTTRGVVLHFALLDEP